MPALHWKRRLGRLLGTRDQEKPRKVILIYHAISAYSPAVSAIAFRQQIRWLAEHARLVDFETLLSDRNTDKGLQVALSFDDGYACLHDVAAPILKDYNTSAIVYLNSAHLGDLQRQDSNPQQGHYPAQTFLLWSEVNALLEAGWLAGSHGCHHLDLTKVVDEVRQRELNDSRADISRRTGQPCDHFAYTWGHYNRSLQAMVQSAGYKTAVTGLHGSLNPVSNPYALPRIDVRADYTLDDFVAAVTGRWDWLGYKQQLMHHLR